MSSPCKITALFLMQKILRFSWNPIFTLDHRNRNLSISWDSEETPLYTSRRNIPQNWKISKMPWSIFLTFVVKKYRSKRHYIEEVSTKQNFLYPRLLLSSTSWKDFNLKVRKSTLKLISTFTSALAWAILRKQMRLILHSSSKSPFFSLLLSTYL